MILSNRALTGAEQPALQQRNHTMDSRKHMFSLPLTALYPAVMHISVQAGRLAGLKRQQGQD
ncbi:MAG: hypothetical protein ACYCOU_11820 [Sulfobacillus sp.]